MGCEWGGAIRIDTGIYLCEKISQRIGRTAPNHGYNTKLIAASRKREAGAKRSTSGGLCQAAL